MEKPGKELGTNAIENLLVDLGLVDRTAIREIFPRVRDRDDVRVMRCEKSGVIFLSSDRHMTASYYQEKKVGQYWSSADRARALLETADDDERRYLHTRARWSGKSLLDFGTGLGGFLERAKRDAASVAGVELQAEAREILNREGLRVHESLAQFPADERFDVITSFHVLEHLLDPIGILKQLRERLRPGGQLVLEVPHARDILISRLQLPEFMGFTFWSEHLILHTRASLRRFCEAAGFSRCEIYGVQRYPLANHLHWLAQRKPGGHQMWADLKDATLDEQYAATLDRLDLTDTLIAVAEA